MGGIDRRKFLEIAGVSLGTVLAGSSKHASASTANSKKWGHSYSMLNDSTRCVGCRACQTACKVYHNLGHTGDNPLYDKPLDLNSRNLTLIKLHQEGSKTTFVKRQCNHCIKPSCASACPVGALKKEDNGIVSYNKDLCIGCRYCQIACTYQIPTFEFEKALPKIWKCDFCPEKTAKGELPECARVCPAGAITFGTRDEMLKEAYSRIEKNPGKYIKHVYGEKEIGGTSVLYLSSVPFEKIGLPDFPEKPMPDLPEKIQHGLFYYFIPPVALFATMGLIKMASKNSPKEGV